MLRPEHVRDSHASGDWQCTLTASWPASCFSMTRLWRKGCWGGLQVTPCSRRELSGALPAAFMKCLKQVGPGRAGGSWPEVRAWRPAQHACQRSRREPLRTFFMRGMGLTDHHCRMASRWCTGSLAKGCMGGHMDSSIHGGATVAVPGPVLRRKNSLQASGLARGTPDMLHRQLGRSEHGCRSQACGQCRCS